MVTEVSIQVGRNPVSYSGAPGLKYELGDGSSPPISGFPQSIQANAVIVPEIMQ
jgi:hypothetical protein